MEEIFFMKNGAIEYPLPDENYSPHEAYPEYPFSHLAVCENKVYDMVRRGFWELGMDEKNRGTKEWNPLGDFIRSGQTVLIKPNWVRHENREEKEHNMECMVTHPSVIRAVMDYVVLAFKKSGGSGTIIVADAPIQSCDFDRLMEKMHYNDLWEFYRKQEVDFAVKDLRGRIISEGEETTNEYETVKNAETGILIDLGNQSAFAGLEEERYEKLRITSYDPDILNRHHTKTKHEYLISREALEADVIINLAKPKAHRKAGLTACAKNLVGICSRKEYLPHHTAGALAVQNGGGDEYLNKSLLRRWDSICVDKYNHFADKKSKWKNVFWFFHRFLGRGGRALAKDAYSEGSWYGNDTIWRTIVDLNTIIQFTDSNGQMHSTPQREILNVCDMISAGEGEGPLLPSPKKMGAIVMGRKIPAVDRFVCSLVGFDASKIRYISRLMEEERLTASDIVVVDYEGNRVPFEKWHFSEETYIRPSSGWAGHIEIHD